MCFLILNYGLHNLKSMMIMEGFIFYKRKHTMNRRTYSLKGWINGNPPFFFIVTNNGLTSKLLTLLTYGRHQWKEFYCAKH
jgi:hypothetical protein